MTTQAVAVNASVKEDGTVTSSDGTRIAYTKQGQGLPLVFVDGAWCHRGFGPVPKLAPLLAKDFTVITYDRRGRGDSTDTPPYAVDKEIEDLQAVAATADGPAFLVGTSSGAVLAMRAAAAGVPTSGLVMYEPPLTMADAPGKQPPERMEEIEQMVAEGRRGEAASTFMTMVGMPALMVPVMKLMRKTWKQLEGVAHTVPYDFAVLAHAGASKPLPSEIADAARQVSAPTLVLDGGKSPPYMGHAADKVAQLIPGAERRTLAKQTHNVSAPVFASAVADFCLQQEVLA